MAYINRIIGKDEKLVGVARLHWIYIVKGLIWFVIFAYMGSIVEGFFLQAIAMTGDTVGTVVQIPYMPYITSMLMSLAHSINMIHAGIGAFILLMYIMKVWATEVGLTNKRIIYKRGTMAVNIKQIDLEEIRGEHIDYGMFGRFFRYGKIRLDCKLIGDVRLPAIAHADTFIKAMHFYRSKTQDPVEITLGDGRKATFKVADEFDSAPVGRPDLPETNPQPPKPETQPVPAPTEPTPPPQPEILPPQEPAKPEVQIPPQAQQELVAATVAQVVEQVVPKIVKEIAEQGLIQPVSSDAAPPAKTTEPEELLEAFDDAAFKLSAKSVEESAKAKHSVH